MYGSTGFGVRLPLLLAGVLLACLFSLALAQRAEAFVHWTNQATGTIGRANNDGTGVDQAFISGASSPTAVDVKGKYIYWASNGSSTIGRAKLDGTEVDQSFITGARGPIHGLDASSDSIFWVADTMTNNGYIWQADIDGTNARVLYEDTTGWDGAQGLAVYGDYIYFTSHGWAPDAYDHWWEMWGVYHIKFNKDGYIWGSVNTVVGLGRQWRTGVLAGDTYVYWLDEGGICRATHPLWLLEECIVPAADAPGAGQDLAMYDKWLYWTVPGGGIGRVKKDDTESQADFITGCSQPYGIDADGGHVATVGHLSLVAGRRGSLVTITGRHFGARRGAGVVRFGRAVVGRYLRWSDHRIVVAVPKTAPLGRVKLAVRTKYGASEARSFSVRP